MKFIAIDLECNQPSGNIIQIGAAVFDTSLKNPYVPINELSTFVDPGESINWNYPISEELTLRQFLGKEWEDNWKVWKTSTNASLLDFWEWVNTSQAGKKIVQWGSGDLKQIYKQSSEQGITIPKHIRNIDLKVVHQLLFQPALKLPKQYGLKSACINFNIPFEGRAHDALTDATNTGKLTVKMFKILESYQKMSVLFKKENL